MRRLSNLLTITTIISYVRNVERRFDWGYTLMDKDEIIELAKISGCDLDGDVVLIGDKTYYVHIFKNIVEEM